MSIQSKITTYDDVATTLFEDKVGYIFDPNDRIIEFSFGNCGLGLPFNATSQQQLEKLGAINMLLNVSVYLNENWEPSWIDEEEKWSIALDPDDNSVYPIEISHIENNSRIVYFKSKKLAAQAIKILGADCIRKALTTTY